MGRLIERLQASPVICAEGLSFRIGAARLFASRRVCARSGVGASRRGLAVAPRAFARRIGCDGRFHLLRPPRQTAPRRQRGLARAAQQKRARARQASRRRRRKRARLVAGNICNTNIYDPAAAEKTGREATAMFEEQIGWARDAGVDFILAETFSFHEEAMLALQACKRAGMEAVVNVVSHATGKLRDGPTPAESCKMLEDAGAEVVGMNCNRGPATMWPLLVEIRQAVACEVAAIPVPFRTNVETPTFQSFARFRRRIVFARGHARVSGRDRCARLHPLRDGRFRAPLRRRRHSLCRRLLRRRPAPCPLDGRGVGAATARVALLARHVEALRARRQSGAQAIESRFSGEIVTAAARR